jgi:hypothetical protein
MSLELEKVVKLLNLSTSDNDHEALLAISKANEFVRKANLTWDEILLKEKPKVHAPIPEWKRGQEEARREFESNPQFGKTCEYAFSKLLDLEGLKARDFILSLQSQYQRKGYLSMKQIESLVLVFETCFPNEMKDPK